MKILMVKDTRCSSDVAYYIPAANVKSFELIQSKAMNGYFFNIIFDRNKDDSSSKMSFILNIDEEIKTAFEYLFLYWLSDEKIEKHPIFNLFEEINLIEKARDEESKNEEENNQ